MTMRRDFRGRATASAEALKAAFPNRSHSEWVDFSGTVLYAARRKESVK